MGCPRCNAETVDDAWCAACDRAYDTWSRRNASDILLPLFAGGFIVASTAILLPLLGLDWIIAATGVFGGFGTLYGLHRLNRRRRRRQFLKGASVPRAYLPSGES